MAEPGLAAKLRGTGPIGLVVAALIVGANLIIAPLGAILVLVWAWRAKVPWTDLGFRRPHSWVATLAGGIIAGIFLKLLLKSLIMPALGAPAINARFHFITGDRAQLISMIVASVLVGGIAEEIVYRGFLFERLWRLLGQTRPVTIAIVLLTSAFFGAIHIPEQGIYGGVQAVLTGLVSGSIYATTRSLWLPMIIHATYDVTAVVIIYLGLETRVAQFLLG